MNNPSASSLTRCMRCIALCAFMLGALAATARADTITDWNVVTLEILRVGNVGGNPGSRALAIVHVAMSDAVNTVQNRYTRHAATMPLDPKASADAAAAAAARSALARLYPQHLARIDEAYAVSMKAVPEGADKVAGIAIGEAAAAAVIADRATDDTSVPDTYRPVTAPGVWVPTAPPLFAEYARAKPWVVPRADHFRPGPPPALASAAYASDYNETKDLGGAKSQKRTQQQSEAVKFWTQPNFPVVWFHAARTLSAAKNLGLADNARLFALLSMGFANSFIVDWDAKFHYNFWRPVTAIRNGDMDGNDATERDAGWTPLNATPMHPEYPSQAAIIGGVGASVLESVFGADVGRITVADSADPKLTRSFERPAQMAEEQRLVRIWGGIHFRSSLSTSDDMGRKLTAYLVANALKPVNPM